MNRLQETVQRQLAEHEQAIKNPEVQTAAKGLCQARCSLYDRDPHCQTMGRCGTNWEMYLSTVVTLGRYPVFDIPDLLWKGSRK